MDLSQTQESALIDAMNGNTIFENRPDQPSPIENGSLHALTTIRSLVKKGLLTEREGGGWTLTPAGQSLAEKLPGRSAAPTPTEEDAPKAKPAEDEVPTAKSILKFVLIVGLLIVAIWFFNTLGRR